MDETASIYANTNDPYLRLNGVWYRRISGPGWTRISDENKPVGTYSQLQRVQWAAYRSSFIEKGLLDEKAADAIEAGLPAELPTKKNPESL